MFVWAKSPVVVILVIQSAPVPGVSLIITGWGVLAVFTTWFANGLMFGFGGESMLTPGSTHWAVASNALPHARASATIERKERAIASRHTDGWIISDLRNRAAPRLPSLHVATHDTVALELDFTFLTHGFGMFLDD